MIVLCDREAVHKLLDKKGSIYSDRPHTYVGHLLTQGDMIALEQMDGLWREKRKVVAHNFSPKQLDEKHFKVQEAEATMLMADLLNEPKGFYNHIRRYTASVASVLVFGSRGPTFESFWAHGVYDVMAKVFILPVTIPTWNLFLTSCSGRKPWSLARIRLWTSIPS
jgi:cytochrome P450